MLKMSIDICLMAYSRQQTIYLGWIYLSLLDSLVIEYVNGAVSEDIVDEF